MNVFVLCTGRCGSTTFAEACQHATNYTAAHESNWGKVGRDRMTYPDDHIEADNRLSWMLGQLEERYGSDAFYVHLRRDKEATAQSFHRRWEGDLSIVKAYARSILAAPQRDIEICRSYIDCVTSNIQMFLRDKPGSMTIDLEHICDQFPEFWQRIGARGDLDAATKTFDTVFNASTPPTAPSQVSNRDRFRRALRRLGR